MTDPESSNNSRHFQVSPKRDFVEASRVEAFIPTCLEDIRAEYKRRQIRYRLVAELNQIEYVRPPRPQPPVPEPIPPPPPPAVILLPLVRPRPRRPPRIEAIQWAVCEHYGLAMIELLSARRQTALASARQVGMYLAKVLTTLSLPQIAARFHRDHTTVIHAVRVIEERLRHDEELEASVAMLKDRLEP